MKVDLGVYSKNQKDLPKVIGPRRRLDRRTLASKAIENRGKKSSKVFQKLFLLTIIVGIFVAVGFGVLKFNSYTSRVSFSGNNAAEGGCDNILNPKCWTEAFKPTLKKTDNFTNVLLVGIDTRPAGDGSDLKNTDTIIIGSINHTTKKVMLISIPRDMLVKVRINDKYCCTMKVNSVYALGDARDDVDDGMELLKSNVKDWLGLDIHYTAIVNFNSVKETVDAVGGVEINVEKKVTALYPEEDPPYDYETYTFEPGVQVVDGKRALVWSRFRSVYSGDQSYASDFSRAERQQEVIDGLKEKVLADGEGTTQKAQKYWKLYQSLADDVTVESIVFEDLLAGLSLVNDFDKNPINIVLDPNFGGLNSYIVTGTQESFGYHIIPKDETWASIRAQIASIWENSDVFDDSAVVVMSNRTGASFGTDSLALQLQSKDLPFGGLYLITDEVVEGQEITIIDFSNGEKQRTVDYLKNYFNTENVISNPIESGIEPSGYEENIRIEFGAVGGE